MGATTALRGLTPEHYESLSVGSSISDEVIENRGYKSLEGPCEAIAKFDAYQVQGTGLWLPGWTVTGDEAPGQYRPDQPRTITSNDGATRILKYETPAGAANYLDVLPMMRQAVIDSTQPVFIIEGVKKADALASRGVPAIALSGVWNWRGKVEGTSATKVLADFDEIPWKGRVVVVAFDSDILGNENVKLASDRLCAVLYRRGALPRIPDWGRFD